METITQILNYISQGFNKLDEIGKIAIRGFLMKNIKINNKMLLPLSI